MLIRKAALAGVLVFYAMPALAETNRQKTAPKPHTIVSFDVARQPVEIMAVSRGARADTRFHKSYLEECETMAKVMPGYPQPAIMSVDVRFSF
ncbi:MAG: hypothetical protein AAGD92_01950 [Pseudomonadota bacterium]